MLIAHKNWGKHMFLHHVVMKKLLALKLINVEMDLFREKFRMNEQKEKIGFTVACVNEFGQKFNLSAQEAFRYLFHFKGIEFIKENYDVEHTLDFETILEDLEMLCRRNGGML